MLYDGEDPAESIKMSSPVDVKRSQAIYAEDEYFEKGLSPEDYKRFEKLVDIRHDENTAYDYANLFAVFA